MKNKYELIYEGKAKKVFTHNDANKVKIEFKDEATAFNALKKEKFEGKGKLNCLISARTVSYTHLTLPTKVRV